MVDFDQTLLRVESCLAWEPNTRFTVFRKNYRSVHITEVRGCVRVAGLFEFLCGVSHRQGIQRCATLAHQYFKVMHDVDDGQLAKARLGLSAPSVGPNAIGERRSESGSAVASSEDGPGMYQPG